jgi:plasmid stability protein
MRYVMHMASLTIRNLEEDTKERLRVRAAQNGRSMEEEARAILRATVAGATAADLWTRSRALFAGSKGVDLALPSRRADRTPPTFSPDE